MTASDFARPGRHNPGNRSDEPASPDRVPPPGRLPEMFEKMQTAFVRAGEEGSVVPIHMFYREWAVVVEIERHPQAARRLHAAEQALMSDDAQVRDAAIREAGEIVRAAHHAITGE